MLESKLSCLPSVYRDALNKVFFDLSKEFLVIPIYQRKYKWNKKDVRTLLDDISAKFQENKKLWLGTILLHLDDSGKFIIIDGQQRILTMFLIFKIFLDNFSIEGKIENENDEYAIYTNENDKTLVMLKTIKEFLSNKYETENKRLNFIIKNVFEKFKQDIKERLCDFQQYVKTQIFCSILILPNNSYEYFENINSKATKLTLTEQCIAFLTSKKPQIFKNKKNNKLFVWLISDDKHPILSSDMFFERFVDVYAEKNKKNPFLGFKEFMEEKKENCQTFIEFLKETKELILTEDKSFKMNYLKKVCFIDYWIVYVRSKVEKSDKFIGYFLNTIWKFDLIRHLNKIAKTSIKKRITDFVRKQINNDEYNKVLQKIMIKSNGYSEDENKKIILSFKGKILDIETINTNIKKRLRTFFYILYFKKKERPDSYFQFIKKLNQIDIDHVCAKNGSEAKKYKFTTTELEWLTNLRPLDKNENNLFGDGLIEEKLAYEPKKEFSLPFVKNLIPIIDQEIKEDWEKAGQKEPKNKKNRIYQFWKERENSLDQKLDSIRKEFLTLEIGNSSQNQ